MKVLLTGSTGYLGSRIASQLSEEKNINPFILNSSHLLKGDFNKFKDIEFEIVIHCAGYVPKNKGEDFWVKSVQGNIETTKNIFKNLKFKKFLYISTCETYSKPLSNYAKSKLTAEKYCLKESKKRKIGLIVLKYTTIIGPTDKINRAIPNFLKNARANKDLKVSNPIALRDYIYIEDAARIIPIVIKKWRSGIYNISSGKGISILNVAKKIIKLSHSKSRIKINNKSGDGKESRLVFSNQKARKYFNFKLQYDFEAAIKEIIRQI